MKCLNEVLTNAFTLKQHIKKKKKYFRCAFKPPNVYTKTNRHKDTTKTI